MSEQNQESIYLKLMQEMGAKPYEGFNPIGARSHRWMMDVKYPPKFRAFGWVLWRTIDRDRDGRTGPPKKKRTAFAHDERAGKGGHLEAKHMHEDLGMTLANAIDELTQLAKEERIRIDEKGRIWLRADSPEPIRIQGEDTGHGNDRVGPIFFCIENCPEAYRLIFQSLDKTRRAQYVRLYRKMPGPLAKHYETLDPEPRARHTWNYLQAAEYKEQLEADAAAAARGYGRAEVDRVIAESGYVDEETRGRKEVQRELTIELKVRVEPATFYIQKNGANSVHNENSILYKGENGSVQKSASLFDSLSGSECSQVSGAVENEETAENTGSPAQTPTTRPHSHSQNLPEMDGVPDAPAADVPADPLADPDPLISYVQHKFKRRLGSKDILRTQLPMLPAQFGIPVSGVRLFWDDLFQKKQERNYQIETPGALYEFTAVGKDGRQPDLAIWIRRNGERVAHVARRDEANGIRPEPEFAPETYNVLMRELKAKVKGMS